MLRTTLTAAAAAAMIAAPAAADTQGVTDDEVIVGSFNDLSGPFAAFGVPATQAAQIYFDRVNAAGGVHGRKITYIVEDHGYQVPKAMQTANKLINRDQVFAMLLSLGTPHNIAAFRLMDAKRIPSVSPLSAARQMLQDPIDLKFMGLNTYYDEMRAGARYMIENEGAEVFCAMYLPTDFGIEVIDGAKAEAEAQGKTWGAETKHKPDEIDFVGALGQLREANCDVIGIALGLRQVITAVGTAKKIGWTDVKFLGSSAAFHTVVAKVPGGATEGMYVAASWQDIEARLDVPEVQDFVGAWKEATGEDLPGSGAMLGWGGAETFVRALEAAGPDLTVDSFVAGMKTLSFTDHVGNVDIRYGPNDHRGSDTVYVSRIENGSWAVKGEVATDVGTN